MIGFFGGRIYSLALIFDINDRLNESKDSYDKLDFETTSWRELSKEQQQQLIGKNFFAYPDRYVIGEEREFKPGIYHVEYYQNAIITINGIQYELCTNNTTECVTKIPNINLKEGDVVIVDGGIVTFLEDDKS